MGVHVKGTKEAMAMNRNWLRGMLLGVSLALLLAGGVALAQGLVLTADKLCVECYPGLEPDEQHIVHLTLTGHTGLEVLCVRYDLNGVPVLGPICDTPPPEDPAHEDWAMPCEPRAQRIVVSFVDSGAQDLDNGFDIEDLYGEWTATVWVPGTGNVASVTWVFAADCLASEFVPEPGSVILLGSGLAGLAGYASLRWRSRD
jgi:hypothetical protein